MYHYCSVYYYDTQPDIKEPQGRIEGTGHHLRSTTYYFVARVPLSRKTTTNTNRNFNRHVGSPLYLFQIHLFYCYKFLAVNHAMRCVRGTPTTSGDR